MVPEMDLLPFVPLRRTEAQQVRPRSSHIAKNDGRQHLLLRPLPPAGWRSAFRYTFAGYDNVLRLLRQKQLLNNVFPGIGDAAGTCCVVAGG